MTNTLNNQSIRESIVLCIYSRRSLTKQQIYTMLKHLFNQSELLKQINKLLEMCIIEPTFNYKIIHPNYQLVEDKFKQVSTLLKTIII